MTPWWMRCSWIELRGVWAGVVAAEAVWFLEDEDLKKEGILGMFVLFLVVVVVVVLVLLLLGWMLLWVVSEEKRGNVGEAPYIYTGGG